MVAGILRPGVPNFVMYIPILRNYAFADVLFHEVGHHLDHTIGAPTLAGRRLLNLGMGG